ncbi:hypothetical protein B0A49_08649 [Cryomyces minteri]|uniref:DNA-directed RNA polymerase III RPC4 n=2 Tax=Cryomyces minteri TaxID=331657 RepID=A0A4U0WX10_9PEZI|nr:hypothetical protein B0A49_08649 [Cryomyces minteri]
MTPKGSGRGRGRGRSAAKATGRLSAETSGWENPDIDPAASNDSIAAPGDPKETSSATLGSSSIIGETQDIAATTSTPAPSSLRPPVERLDSLRGTGSGSGSPAPGRGKKTLKQQPKFIGRRSKEERDALEAAEAARRRARIAAAEAEANAKIAERGGFRGRGRSDRGSRGGRGRGGFMGDNLASGPFSAGTVTQGSRGFYAQRSGRRIGGRGDGSSGHRIKRESGIKIDEDGDFSMLGIPRVKSEYEGYTSSDPEDGNEVGPRTNVDTIIDLISDAEDSGEDRDVAMRQKMIGTSGLGPGLQPVRIKRVEHEDRKAGAKKGTSASAPIKIEDEAAKKDGHESHRNATAHAIDEQVSPSKSRRGKAKVKDVEFVRDERRWKGVYQEDSDRDGEVRIKEEPRDEEDGLPMLPVENVTDMDSLTQVKEPPSSPGIKKKVPQKPRVRRRSGFRGTKPVIQTKEEQQEWDRHVEELGLLSNELGHIVVAASAPPDAEGDTPMEDAAQAKSEDKKAGRVYLFQFPPIVPDLIARPTVKEEPTSFTQTRGNSIDVDATPASIDKTPVKIEDDVTDADELKSKSFRPKLATGAAGKLRIHESGRATLSWGGTSLELNMGIAASLLQDTMLMKITPENQRVTANDGGEAMSFGQIRGKFVVTPDWDEIIG